MSSNNPYGPYPGPSGPGQPGQPGQPIPGQPPGGVPSGPPTPYGYPQQPPTQPLPSSGYTFGPFAPQGPPSGPGGPGGPYSPPPGYRPPPPGGPPPKRSNTKVALIAGAAALVVLAGGTGIVLASQSDNSSPDPTVTRASSIPGPSASGAVPLPPTSSASDAVAGYLQALASSDAKTALGYSAEPLAAGGTLSSKVLAASNRRAKLTGIDVPAVTDANATSVDATYKLGTKTVTETFAVMLVGTDWKLKQVVADVSLAADREPGIPMKINGATVKSDTVSLFPGSYEVTSGLKTVSYGSHDTLLVKRPSDLPTSRLKLTLTTTGKKAGRAAAKKSYRSCLQAKAIAPKGCPFGLTTGDFKVAKSTVNWDQRGSDPFKRAKFDLSGRTIEVKVKINVVMNADCSINGRPATCSGNVKAGRVAYVLSTNLKKRVVWAAS